MVAEEQVEDPVPGPGQVLVAPIACGICGSDLHLVEAQAARPDVVPAMVLGHEFVGEVLEFGPETERRLPAGSKVTSVPYLDTAAGPQLIGLSPMTPGGLAELTVLQERRLLPVPAGLDVRLAALAEPLAVGVHAVATARMDRSDVALVVGCGPVGLSVIAALKSAGHGPIVAADFSAARRRLAETTGADVVVDPADTSPYRAWAELAGPPLPPSPLLGSERPNTVVFECVGRPGVLQSIIDSALPHTRMVVVGACNQPDSITPVTALAKELSLQFVFAYRSEEFEQALRWIVDGVVAVEPWVTRTCGLQHVNEAFAELRQPGEQCKILVTPKSNG
jgi:threonine dehydrogenase-like Zn-dependent dehydrogenase